MAAPGQGLEGDPSLLRAVLDATRLLIVVVDREGSVRMVNRAFERATGLPSDACLRPLWELAALPRERDLLRATFGPGKTDAPPTGMLFHLVRQAPAPGSDADNARVVDWDVRVLNAEAGTPAAVVLTGIDVSERLHAEQRLRESEELQRRILDRLPAIVWTTDRDLKFTFSAGGGLRSLGLTAGQVALTGTSLFSYFHTDDPNHPGIAPHVRALHGESSVFEQQWFDHQFQSRVEPLLDREQKIVGAIGLALDVTAEARTQKALRDSEAHLRRLVDANVIGIFFWDESGRVTEANEAFLELIGFSRDELLSGDVSWRAITAPEDHLLDERAMAEAKATGRCSPYEKRFVAKDGALVPALVGSATFDGTHGAVSGVAFILDLREQVRLRDTRDQLLLQEQRARIETEVSNARLLLLVEGSKRLARTLNPRDTLETLAALAVPGLADWSYIIHRGWSGEPTPSMVASAHGDPNRVELLRRLHECRPDLAAPEGASRVFRTGEVAQYDDVKPEQLMPGAPAGPIVGTRDPEHLHVVRELGMRSLLCVPIAGRNGVDGVMMLVSASDPHRYGEEDVFLARDLASRAATSLENGRLLIEALDAVKARDEFLAVAAHELRTPLTSLMLQVQVLERALDRRGPDGDVARRGLTTVEGQARRLSTLVDGLLDVARLATNRLWLELGDVQLRPLIDGLVATMAPDFQRARCKVTVTMPDEVTGRWDRVRVEQVLTNLLTNALKFGPGRPIEVNVQATATHVVISVRDHGMGISKDAQDRIFGRFERAVSTRHFGGLGLGLYISAQILRAHHGSIRVESEPGQGACFIVELPLGLQNSSVPSEPPPSK